MIPKVRNLKMLMPKSKIRTWHKDGAHTTLFFNQLSLFLPEAERFVISTVRHFRDTGQIKDPDLLAKVNGLIGQEAIHAREHDAYNDGIKKAYFGPRILDGIVTDFIRGMERNISPQARMAATAAAEHLTACLADEALLASNVLDRAEQPFRDLWQWHAEEEVEHKSVTFEVYEHVYGDGLGAYMMRTSMTALITAMFWPAVLAFHLFITLQDRQLRKDYRGQLALLNMLFYKPGILRGWLKPYLAGYGRNFHPWQHDTRSLLGQADEIAARIKTLASAA